MVHYLSLPVLPLPARHNLVYQYQLSTGILTPVETLPALIIIVSLACLVFLLYNKNRLASFALFWLLVNLLVEYTIISLELVFGRRIYLPSMFLFLAGTAWCY